jgi:hypothetical protein
MTISTLNVEPYLDNVVGKALRLNKQALALAIPYILADYFKSFTLLYNEDSVPVLCDRKTMWKVVCGRKTFDIAPSFTKGCGRDKSKVNPIEYLITKGYDGVCFVDFTEVNKVVVKWMEIDNLPDTVSGVYKRGEVFE